MNGDFPQTYSAEPDMTATPHGNIDELILIAELENLMTSKGKKFMDWYNPETGDVMIGGLLPGYDEETVRRIYDPKSEFWQQRMRGGLAKGQIAEVEPIHMPSYATLMEMAFDYPWEVEGEKASGKALEMLLTGKELTEKMRMGDVPGGTVSYHLPDLYRTGRSQGIPELEWLGGVAKKGEKQRLSEEEFSTMIWGGNMPRPLKPSIYRETPDTTKTFASGVSRPRYAHQTNIETRPGEAPDTTYEKIGLFPPGSKWDEAYEDDYMWLLRSLLHEPFHLKTAQKSSGGYGFTHDPGGGEYSQGLFNDIEELLTKSLLAKLSKKDIIDITKRLVSGEEIDFSKYKRLDIGGE